MRISNSALQKAGAIGFDRALEGHRSLAALLKHMVRHGALANGRNKRRGYTRRRYGTVLLIIKEGTLIDLVAESGPSHKLPSVAA